MFTPYTYIHHSHIYLYAAPVLPLSPSQFRIVFSLFRTPDNTVVQNPVLSVFKPGFLFRTLFGLFRNLAFMLLCRFKSFLFRNVFCLLRKLVTLLRIMFCNLVNCLSVLYHMHSVQKGCSWSFCSE